jgi:hypothetical protein
VRMQRTTYILILARRMGKTRLGLLVISLLVDLALLVDVTEEDLFED